MTGRLREVGWYVLALGVIAVYLYATFYRWPWLQYVIGGVGILLVILIGGVMGWTFAREGWRKLKMRLGSSPQDGSTGLPRAADSSDTAGLE